jgi:hypothetical protein
MSRNAMRWMALLAGLTLSLPGRAATAQAPARDAPKYETFQILLTRNIFDPQRRPGEHGAIRHREESTTSTTERISLEGVLIDKGLAVAFFEGTDASNTATVRLGSEIAGHRLIEVRTDRIRLARKGRTLELPVAGQLSRPDRGAEWEIAKEVIPIGAAATGEAAAGEDEKTSTSAKSGAGKMGRPGRMRHADKKGKPGGASEAGSASGPADTGDVEAPAKTQPLTGRAQDLMMKKLLERRRKELGQ